MSEFKVGDRVRVRSSYMDLRVGDVGTVVETCDTSFGQCCQVETDDGHTSYPCSRRLELVEPEQTIKAGDRVRVTVEATVKYAYSNGDQGLEVEILGGRVLLNHSAIVGREDNLSVEKIEPPVEQFGPGTFVRSKAVPDYTYLVLQDGYVDLYNNIYNPNLNTEFNSQNYERVEMVEPPL